MATQDESAIIREGLLPTSEVHSLAAKGGFWIFILRAISVLLSIGRLIILARLLDPNDFGLMGLAMLMMMIIEMLGQTGFHQALIQKKDCTEAHLNTAWTIGIGRGFILAIILYAIGPFAATFFRIADAKEVIQVMGLLIVCQGFYNVGIVYFQKSLQFNKYFVYELSGVVVDFIVVICAVVILRNVWAIVLGKLAGNIVRCLLSYILHPYRPHFNLDIDKAKELWLFGKWMLGSSILVFIIIQGDDLFVTKLLGGAALGLYQMAYKISNLPTTEIAHVISQVAFPTYSQLQDDTVRLKNAFLRFFQLTALLSLPTAGLIFSLSGDSVRILMGEKWLRMIPSLQMLLLWGVIRGFVGSISAIFMAIGKPQIVTKLQGFQAVLLLMLLWPLTSNWGISGASAAVLFSALAMFFVRSHILIGMMNYHFWEYYRAITVPFILTLACVVLVIGMKGFVAGAINIGHVVFFAAVFMICFVFLVYIFDRTSFNKIRLTLYKIIGKKN